jgi:hypothetical protein
VDQITFETEYKSDPAKIRRDLMDEGKICKKITDELKKEGGVFHDPRGRRGKGIGIGARFKKRDVLNYLDNIRGIRKVQAKPGDSKWYYLVRAYKSEIDDDNDDNIRQDAGSSESMLIDDSE